MPLVGTAATFVIAFLTGERTTVTDALGQTWRTGDIYETSIDPGRLRDLRCGAGRHAGATPKIGDHAGTGHTPQVTGRLFTP
ncbi:hypothetical protein [Nonomuraea sp. 10N515B]|uniref:hypothetical protein n=1 Tax=Nonomuraea sp. 10N515B TaxID=3457422 RepID=UPI003FCD738C